MPPLLALSTGNGLNHKILPIAVTLREHGHQGGYRSSWRLETERRPTEGGKCG